MLVSPFLAFWILIFLGRDELGLKGVLWFSAIWAGLLAGFMYVNIPSYWFVAVQAFLDIILIVLIVGRDVRIR